MPKAARPVPDFENEDAAELTALAAAVAEADADPSAVPHADVRAWLLELAAGNFDAPQPVARSE
jgi:hypothetical protein